MPKLKDLTGMKFGKLFVIEQCENKEWNFGRSRPQWLCRCECGNYKKVSSQYLVNGHTKSCGCDRINDLTGKVFGHLKVEKLYRRVTQPNGSVRLEWLCTCDCGEKTIVSTGNLTSNHIISCGCQGCSAPEVIIKHILKEKI